MVGSEMKQTRESYIRHRFVCAVFLVFSFPVFLCKCQIACRGKIRNCDGVSALDMGRGYNRCVLAAVSLSSIESERKDNCIERDFKKEG